MKAVAIAGVVVVAIGNRAITSSVAPRAAAIDAIRALFSFNLKKIKSRILSFCQVFLMY